MNKCFKKIVRTKEEPGKGGFWTLDPQYLKEPSSEEDEEEEGIEDELSKDLSETCINKSPIKTEPLSPSISVPASPIMAVKSEINESRKRKADPLSSQGTKICLKFQIEKSTNQIGKFKLYTQGKFICIINENYMGETYNKIYK